MGQTSSKAFQQPTYVIGPVSVTKQIGNGKEIIIFGDHHGGHDYDCPSDGQGTSQKISDYLAQLISTTNKFIDLFLEIPCTISEGKVMVGPLTEEKCVPGYIQDVANQFKQCLLKNLKCPYPNLRVHYTDYRLAIENPLGDFFLNEFRPTVKSFPKNYDDENEMNAYYNRLEDMVAKYKNSLFPIMRNNNSIIQFYTKYLSGLPKYGYASENIALPVANKYIKEHLEGSSFPVDSLKFMKKTKRIIDGTERLGSIRSYYAEADELYDQFIDLETFILDVYILLRLFKTFKHEDKPINNAIIYVGDQHARILRHLLSEMKFDTVFSSSSSTRCVNISSL